MQKIFAVFDDESATNNSSEQQPKSLAGDIMEEESLQAQHSLLEEFEGIFKLNKHHPKEDYSTAGSRSRRTECTRN